MSNAIRGNGGKRKGVDDYAAEYQEDVTISSIIRGGQFVRVLVCRFCYQSIGARSDRIKEHLGTKRHQKFKLAAFREAQQDGRDLTHEHYNDISRLMLEPPIPMLKSPGEALAPPLEVEALPQQIEVTYKGENMKPVMPTTPPESEDNPAKQMFYVKWDNFNSNMVSMFSKLLSQEHFVDVTLWCEGKAIKCHKIVLSACSEYFEKVLTDSSNSNPHPIIILKDMSHCEVQALVGFMYSGELIVEQDKMESLFRAAESLQIKGLSLPSEKVAVPANQNKGRDQQREKNVSDNDNTMTTNDSCNSHSYIGNHYLHAEAVNNKPSNNYPSGQELALGATSNMMGIGLCNDWATSGSQREGSDCAPASKRRRKKETRGGFPRIAGMPFLDFKTSSKMEKDDDTASASENSTVAYNENRRNYVNEPKSKMRQEHSSGDYEDKNYDRQVYYDEYDSSGCSEGDMSEHGNEIEEGQDGALSLQGNSALSFQPGTNGKRTIENRRGISFLP